MWAPDATAPNEVWSMDFVRDELFNGDRIRLLTLVDNFSRVSPWIEVDRSLTGKRVVAVLERIALQHGLPKTIRVDHGTEFTSKAFDQWAYLNGVEIDFTRPGKPTDNAFIESFNGRIRQECLNENWFLSLKDAPTKVEAWGRNTTMNGHTAPWVRWLRPSSLWPDKPEPKRPHEPGI
jgi:putative transposase